MPCLRSSRAKYHCNKVSSATEPSIRADIARKIAKQTAQALDFVHSQGLCHGGIHRAPNEHMVLVLIRFLDMTPSNVLLKVSSIDDWSKEEIYQRFHQPKRDEVTDVFMNPIEGNSAPRYLVEPARAPDAQFLAKDALLVDYGQAFSIDQPPEKEDIGVPFSYCAPKAILDGKFSIYSDIWSLGCVIFEIRAGQQLFQDWDGDENEALEQIVQMKGRMPDAW